MTLSRLEMIQDLLELYTEGDSGWYHDWLHAQTDIQLAEHWKKAFGE